MSWESLDHSDVFELCTYKERSWGYGFSRAFIFSFASQHLYGFSSYFLRVDNDNFVSSLNFISNF